MAIIAWQPLDDGKVTLEHPGLVGMQGSQISERKDITLEVFLLDANGAVCGLCVQARGLTQGFVYWWGRGEGYY
ncbi:hypothetical protein GCM10027512_23170 [Chromohalobacter beijerinckii]